MRKLPCESNSVQYRRETRRERTLSRYRNGRSGFVEATPVRLQRVTVHRKTDTYSSGYLMKLPASIKKTNRLMQFS